MNEIYEILKYQQNNKIQSYTQIGMLDGTHSNIYLKIEELYKIREEKLKCVKQSLVKVSAQCLASGNGIEAISALFSDPIGVALGITIKAIGVYLSDILEELKND